MAATGLSSRKVSLSDHVKRRKSSAALSSSSGYESSGGGGGRGSNSSGTTGSSSSSRGSRYSDTARRRGKHRADAQIKAPPDPSAATAVDAPCRDGGGYDTHAACYGNYDAPSRHRSYGASEHGCYTSERYISPPSSGNGGNNFAVRPRHRSHSNPHMDLEDQNKGGWRPSSAVGVLAHSDASDPTYEYGARRMSEASALPDNSCSSSAQQWDGSKGLYNGYPSRRSQDSYNSCPSPTSLSAESGGSDDSTFMTKSTIRTASTGMTLRFEEDAIRQGIVDISIMIAKVLAGFLSFFIGIFMMLISPFVRLVKLIVGDVRGLLGDAAFLQELGSIWRMYKELRRRSSGSGTSSSDRYSSRSGAYYQYDEESSTDASSLAYTNASSAQFVGGWRPTVGSSVGSGSSGQISGPAASVLGSVNTASTAGSPYNPRRPPLRPGHISSRSHSSLPLVHEDQYQQVTPGGQVRTPSKSDNSALSYPPPGHPSMQDLNSYGYVTSPTKSSRTQSQPMTPQQQQQRGSLAQQNYYPVAPSSSPKKRHHYGPRSGSCVI